MSRCTRCDASDALLFTCSHCNQQFCADHQFPHHACARFTREEGEAVGSAFGDGTTVPRTRPAEGSVDGNDAGDPSVDAGESSVGGGEPGTSEVDGSGAGRSAAADLGTDSATGSGPAGVPTQRGAAGVVAATDVPGPRIAVARDAARETRPDRAGPTPPPPGRGMPWERGDASIAEWMREQTYSSYLLKVGGLSLLLNTAYYGSLVATLYGYV